MNKNAFSASPLIRDIYSQRDLARRRLFRALLFFGLFFALDIGGASLLKKGLERYYGLDTPADLLVVGHSHSVLGVDKQLLAQASGLSVAKYARQGAALADRDLMIRQYFSRYPGRVRAVVLGVEAHLFTATGLSANSHRLFFPFLSEKVVRDYLEAEGVSPTQLLVGRVFRLSRFDETTLALAIRGLLGNWTSYKHGSVDIGRLEKQIQTGDFRRITLDKNAIEHFGELVGYVKQQGIALVLVNYPTVDLFNRAEPGQFEAAMAIIRGCADPGNGVWLLDYNPAFQSRHELFFDPIHLNVDGQREVTKQLAADIQSILQRHYASRGATSPFMPAAIEMERP